MLWGVPKGSYASDPTGPCRIIEFRKMVQVCIFPLLRVFFSLISSLKAEFCSESYKVSNDSMISFGRLLIILVLMSS